MIFSSLPVSSLLSYYCDNELILVSFTSWEPNLYVYDPSSLDVERAFVLSLPVFFHCEEVTQQGCGEQRLWGQPGDRQSRGPSWIAGVSSAGLTGAPEVSRVIPLLR